MTTYLNGAAHQVESKDAGTNVLVLCTLHFN